MRRTPLKRSSGKVIGGHNRSWWLARNDDLFKAIIMLLHGAVRMPNADGRGFHWYGHCKRCHTARVLYLSHIEPKGAYPALRWEERNAFAFCYACHIHWWHKNPREAEAFATGALGAHAREHIAFMARATGRGIRPDMRDTEARLKFRLRQLCPGGVPGLEY